MMSEKARSGSASNRGAIVSDRVIQSQAPPKRLELPALQVIFA